jgi:DNA (cytosine-5)-methyltransferase 1
VALTMVDVFAGCGGLARGFEDSGKFVPVLAIERDRAAAETFRTNFDTEVLCGGIEDVRHLPRVDVLVGGPPCQPFSQLNRHGTGAERRSLWREYLRVLIATDASAFLMENVPGLLRSSEYVAFREQAHLEGFTVSHRVLDAADFGVPQRRARAIVLGIKGADPWWPAPSNADPRRIGLGQEAWRTFREAVVGLPLTPDGRNWHRARSPRPDSVRRYSAVPHDGGNRFEMQRRLDDDGLGHLVPGCWRRKQTGTTDVFGRLWWDRPACTIRTEFYKPEKGRYLHPTEDRPITVREAARLMSIEDGFRFPETQSMTSVGRQVGNAVPPLLARALASTLADQLAPSTITQTSDRLNKAQLLAV